MVREVLARYLERDGFRVDAVEEHEQAIEAFSTARPDIVLPDLMLSRVDGFEVFRFLRFLACSEPSASQGSALSG